MRILKAGAYHAERGFTLVELGMVILVLGIVMATVMPRFSGTFERQQLRSTVNVVHGTVRYVHAHAALTKRIYRVLFNLDNPQVMSVCYLSGDTCILETGRELRDYAFPPNVRILDVVSPQGVKIREGLAATHFHPTGLAEPSVIHLITDSNQKITLIIEPLAGRVKVYDDYVDPTAS